MCFKHFAQRAIQFNSLFSESAEHLGHSEYSSLWTVCHSSDFFATVWTHDVISLRQEATSHQGHGALLAVKAVIVPLALLEGDVLTPTKTYGRPHSTTLILTSFLEGSNPY